MTECSEAAMFPSLLPSYTEPNGRMLLSLRRGSKDWDLETFKCCRGSLVPSQLATVEQFLKAAALFSLLLSWILNLLKLLGLTSRSWCRRRETIRCLFWLRWPGRPRCRQSFWRCCGSLFPPSLWIFFNKLILYCYLFLLDHRTQCKKCIAINCSPLARQQDILAHDFAKVFVSTHRRTLTDLKHKTVHMG